MRLKIDEAAEGIGVGESTVRRWISHGLLTSSEGLVDEAELREAHRKIRAKPSPGDAEFAALTRAFEILSPRCEGDDRFIADEITRAEVERLAVICLDCPLRILCRSYATKAKPAGGVWAGRVYSRGRA